MGYENVFHPFEKRVKGYNTNYFNINYDILLERSVYHRNNYA